MCWNGFNRIDRHSEPESKQCWALNERYDHYSYEPSNCNINPNKNQVSTGFEPMTFIELSRSHPHWFYPSVKGNKSIILFWANIAVA